jgi:hypothetical protein
MAVLIGVGMISYAQDVENNTHLGTWVLTVTPPVGGPPAFKALASFASGGVFISSGQNDHVNTGVGIQQGTWRRTAGGQITSTEISFIYGPTGVAIGTLKVQATYEFSDANNLTGHGQLSRCDLSGANCQSLGDCASIQGKRVEVEEPICP